MAGNPKRRQVQAELLRRAREDQGDITPGTEADALVDLGIAWMASGKTLHGLAVTVSTTLGIDVNREMVRTILERAADETNRAPAFALARTRGAHALVEEGLELVDDVAETRAAIMKAKLQAESRQWVASAWNRAEFGQQLKVEGSISVQHLHLDAMRQRVMQPAAEAPVLAPAAAEDVEYEVLEAGDEAKVLPAMQLALALA